MDDEEIIELVKKYNKTKSREDYLIAVVKYLMKRVECEIIIDEEEKLDSDARRLLGMGFFIMAEDFKRDDEVLDFFASRMLEEIYKDKQDIGLEKYLHEKFSDKNTLIKIGVKNYIINSVYTHDEYLSGYLETHTYLIENLANEIKDIIDKWDLYFEYDSEIIKEITENFVSYHDDCAFTSYDLIHYLKYKMDIDVLDKDFEEDDEVLNNSEYYRIIFDNPKLQDEKILQEYGQMIEDYIYKKEEPDFYVITENIKKAKNKRKKGNTKAITTEINKKLDD